MGPQADRIRNVLAGAFRGIHHCSKIHKFYEGTENEMWEVNPYGEISTFDFDVLTRLVIAAHDECVRVGICSSGPGMIKIRLWPRFSRDGLYYDKHPTIEQAVELYRGKKP